MKNTVIYYYNLKVDNIRFYHHRYYFNSLNYNYVLIPYNRTKEEIEAIYELNLETIPKNTFYHEIILNKDQSPVTFVDRVPYVLLKVHSLPNRKLEIFDLQNIPILLNKKNNLLNRFFWTYLWTEKIDYIEYQLKHFEVEYPSLTENVWYFIGLGENAISYVQNALQNNKYSNQEKMAISHRRLSSNQSLFEYYNPLTLIIDHPVRDLSEYLKSYFFEDNYSMEKINSFLVHTPYSALGYQLLFGRLLFPSFYFDAFEKILNHEEDEKNIMYFNNRIREYELYLNEIYVILSQYSDLEPIDWLIKKT